MKKLFSILLIAVMMVSCASTRKAMVGFQAIKAAIANSVKSLKTE